MIISFDGLAEEYLHRGILKNLDLMAIRGVKAEVDHCLILEKLFTLAREASISIKNSSESLHDDHRPLSWVSWNHRELGIFSKIIIH